MYFYTHYMETAVAIFCESIIDLWISFLNINNQPKQIIKMLNFKINHNHDTC